MQKTAYEIETCLEYRRVLFRSDLELAFLREIGYLVDEPGEFEIATQNIDSEIAETAGPQLVVPILNARFRSEERRVGKERRPPREREHESNKASSKRVCHRQRR